MKWINNNTFELEDGEPSLRSCWECNPGHEHLKRVNSLHVCFNCGRRWVGAEFIPSMPDATDDEFVMSIVEFLTRYGIKPGQSTRDLDKGYRTVILTVGLSDGAQKDAARSAE